MQATLDFGQLIEAIGDAIVVSDTAGAITFWNPAAERMFGYTRDEALGRSLDLIIPERLRQRHWAGYHQTMRTGQTRYGSTLLRVPALHKDGHALSIAFTVALLPRVDQGGVDQGGADRRVTGVVTVIRDETQRWEEESQIRRRLSELEAKAVRDFPPEDQRKFCM